MAEINSEARLAVKLFRIAQKRKPGYQDHINEIDAVADAAKLMSMARALHRLDEAHCNRELSPRETTRCTKLEHAICELLNQYGLEYDHNGDPRGYAVYIHFPDGCYNSMGGPERGWGI